MILILSENGDATTNWVIDGITHIGKTLCRMNGGNEISEVLKKNGNEISI